VCLSDDLQCLNIRTKFRAHICLTVLTALHNVKIIMVLSLGCEASCIYIQPLLYCLWKVSPGAESCVGHPLIFQSTYFFLFMSVVFLILACRASEGLYQCVKRGGEIDYKFADYFRSAYKILQYSLKLPL
jgi:hypothetical protein